MIDVQATGSNSFAITIAEGGSQTRHEVTLSDADHERLGGTQSKEACIAAAFAFLLDREPKEAILSRFDLTVIGRYFPQFERELPRYLARL